MKPIIPFALLGALFAVGVAGAAVTKPVGYETITLDPGKFNLVGVRLFEAPVASGVFESSTATTLVDDDASFSLVAATTYVIEFENGAVFTAPGSDFSGTTISNLTGVTAALESSYIVREASTIASVFGASNETGLAASPNADPTEADIILVPSDTGFTRVFYSTFTSDPAFAGWLDADSFEQASGVVILPSDGFFVQTAVSAAPIDLVVTGEVKTTPTAFVAESDFSLLSSVYPAGATLENSGLSAFVQASANADPTEADVVLLPVSGGFTRAFFSTFTSDPAFAGWLDADSFEQVPDRDLTPGYFIQKIGPDINGVASTPSFYSTL